MQTNEVYCGDSIRLLRRLPGGSIQAVIADPMYGVSLKCEYDWGDDPNAEDPTKHWDYHRPYYEECLRVLAPGGKLAWAVPYKYAARYPDWFGEHRLWRLTLARRHLHCATWVVQTKERRPVPVPDRDSFIRVKPLGDLKDRHPCVKPVEEMLFLVEELTRPGDVVLDPFCGTGTTLLAAQRLGRRFIGCDKSPNYCRLAMERLGLR